MEGGGRGGDGLNCKSAFPLVLSTLALVSVSVPFLLSTVPITISVARARGLWARGTWAGFLDQGRIQHTKGCRIGPVFQCPLVCFSVC